MKKMTAYERREAIREYLICHGKTTQRELAEMFGVTDRTIRDDMRAVECSLNIVPVKGHNGGTHLNPLNNPNRVYLSNREQELLESLLPGLQPEEQEIMKGIFRKFSAKK